jgi:hypothetical protein
MHIMHNKQLPAASLESSSLHLKDYAFIISNLLHKHDWYSIIHSWLTTVYNCGSRMWTFKITNIKTHNLMWSWACFTHLLSWQHMSQRSILKYASNLVLSIPSRRFLRSSPLIDITYAFLVYPVKASSPMKYSLLDFTILTICSNLYKVRSSFLYNILNSSQISSLGQNNYLIISFSSSCNLYSLKARNCLIADKIIVLSSLIINILRRWEGNKNFWTE